MSNAREIKETLKYAISKLNNRSVLTESEIVESGDSLLNPLRQNHYLKIINDSNLYKTYIGALAESIDDSDIRERFLEDIGSDDYRTKLLESAAEATTMNLTPYEVFTPPLLRYYYPKVVLQKISFNTNLKVPTQFLKFLVFKRVRTDGLDTSAKKLPVTDEITSAGLKGSTLLPVSINVPASVGTVDLYDAVNSIVTLNIDKSTIFVDRTSFKINSVVFTWGDNTEEVPVNIIVPADGKFSITIDQPSANNTVKVIGMVNFEENTVDISTVKGPVDVDSNSVSMSLKVDFTFSLQLNNANTKITVSEEDRRVEMIDFKLQSEATIRAMKDLKALFDIDVFASLIKEAANQISVDIDQKGLMDLKAMAIRHEYKNDDIKNTKFYVIPPADYAYGQKHWLENIVLSISKMSNAIYKATNISPANVLVANTIDATIFESLSQFVYNGTAEIDGVAGYNQATLTTKRWNMYISPLQAENEVLILYKSDERGKATYFTGVYIPGLVVPYPLGNIPSATFMTTWGFSAVRDEGVARLQLEKTTAPSDYKTANYL